jgi:hypothetical protein
MTIEELMGELHKLNRADKLRAIQVLAQDLAVEEETLVPNVHYEVWSPFDSGSTANALMDMLNQTKQDTNGN